jgi:hypothetical protein
MRDERVARARASTVDDRSACARRVAGHCANPSRTDGANDCAARADAIDWKLRARIHRPFSCDRRTSRSMMDACTSWRACGRSGLSARRRGAGMGLEPFRRLQRMSGNEPDAFEPLTDPARRVSPRSDGAAADLDEVTMARYCARARDTATVKAVGDLPARELLSWRGDRPLLGAPGYHGRALGRTVGSLVTRSTAIGRQELPTSSARGSMR